MPYGTEAPSKRELERYLERGLSQKQIAEEWEKDSGYRVSRSAIGMALLRHGLKSSRARPEYPELIPWTVHPDHRMHNDVRMLRLEGRRQAGLPMSDSAMRWLEQWKDDLRRRNAVIHYEADTPEGFYWVNRDDPEVVVHNDDDLVDRSNATKTSAKPVGGGSPPGFRRPAARQQG